MTHHSIHVRQLERLAFIDVRQRAVMTDRLSAAREAEARAARECRTTDETYREVHRKLAAKWDAALQKVYEGEQRLVEFDAAQIFPSQARDRVLFGFGA